MPVERTRPIVLLSCLSKVFEKCLLIHFRRWVAGAGILPDEQSGFRPQHSTSTRVAQFLQDATQGLEQNSACLAIYVDFSRAFDEVWHEGLLFKLAQLHCPRELVKWVAMYLKDRSCYIEIEGEQSDLFSVSRGVPQGSCLGPLLFLLYHHDLPARLPTSNKSHLYADDLCSIVQASPWWNTRVVDAAGNRIPEEEFLSLMQARGQQVLDELDEYATQWRQPVNVSKTNYQWIHRRVTIPNIPLFISHQIIERISVFKYLGFFTDERLSFSSHVRHILSRLTQNSAMLKFVAKSNTSSLLARRTLFNAFLLPYFQQAYLLYPLLSTTAQESLEAKNRSLFRLIFRWYDARNDEINWLPRFKNIRLRAREYLEKFVAKARIITPELFEMFEQHKLAKLMFTMHREEGGIIDALPRGRPSAKVLRWEGAEDTFLDHLSAFLEL